MWINQKPLWDFGGRLQRSYQVTGYDLTNEAFKGRKRSSFVLLNSSIGFCQLSLPIVFEGCSRHDVTAKKSLFDMEAYGKNDLTMEDGFQYFVYLDSIGEASYPADELIECDYTFIGVRHGDLETVNGNTVMCSSTLPNTDCIIDVTVSANRQNYDVGTVQFPSVTAGEKITVDGINKRILVNGAPAAEQAEWINFPSLIPGKNVINCLDPVTVTYYPVYF